jgi:hypothetical protein
MPDNNDPVIDWAKKFISQPVAPPTNPIDSERSSIEEGAAKLGVDPADYATAMSYETGGTMNPWQKGPVTKWGQHRGTIQYGEPQQRKYGVSPKQSFHDQVTDSNVRYLQAPELNPERPFEDIYKAINAGSVGANLNTQDANTGRTIADNIRLAPSRSPKQGHSEVWLATGNVWNRVDAALGDTPADAPDQNSAPDDIWNKVDDVLSGPDKQLPPIIPNPRPQEPTQTLQTPVGIDEPPPLVQPPPLIQAPAPPPPIQAPTVAPEAPTTIAAQIQSAQDPASPRAGVLTTSTDQNAAFGGLTGFQAFPVNGGMLWVNTEKAKKLKLKTPDDIQTFITKNPDGVTRLIGKVDNVGDTTQGTALVTKDANGNELSSSIVTTPKTAVAQARVDQKQFPQAVTQEIKPAQAVVADRISTGNSTSVAQPTQPTDFKLNPGTPIPPFQPLAEAKPETPALPTTNIDTYADYLKFSQQKDTKKARLEYSQLSATPSQQQSSSAQPVVGTVDVDPNASDEEKMRTALNKTILGRQTPTGSITATDIDNEIERYKAAGIPLRVGNANDPTYTVFQNVLDDIYNQKKKGPDQLAEEQKQRVIAPPADDELRKRAIEELQNEKRTAGLNRFDRDAPESPSIQNMNISEDEIQQKIAEYKALEPSQEEKSAKYDYAQTESPFESGLASGFAMPGRVLSGVLRPFSKSGYEWAAKQSALLEKESPYRNQGEGPQTPYEHIAEFLGATGPQLATIIALPGEGPWGTVAKFAFLGGSETAGRGGSTEEIGKSSLTGAGQGAAFGAAGMFENPLAKLGTVFGGSALVNAASGMPIDQNLQSAIVNTLYEAQGTFGSKLAGKFFQFWKGGEPLTVGVTPEGEVIVPRGNVKTENQVILDPENPVYKNETQSEVPSQPATTVATPANVPNTEIPQPEKIIGAGNGTRRSGTGDGD